MSGSGAERVLVVPRDALFRHVRPFDGFLPADGVGRRLLVPIRREARFADRAAVEEDPRQKQLIPYLPLKCGDSLFLFRRHASQDEARLRNLFSMGVGGHINPIDGDPADADALIAAGLLRELREEMHVNAPFGVRFVGFLNDDANEVGAVHFGLVFRVEVPTPAVEVAEKSTMSGAFAELSEIRRRRDEMESWSRLLLDGVESWFAAPGLPWPHLP